MRLLVWGLGYVGSVSAACLSRLGHEVIGVEPNSKKVAAINSGGCAILEPGLDKLIKQAVDEGRLKAVEDGRELLDWADASIICVGTPSGADGGLSLGFLRKVAADIGQGLRSSNSYHLILLRSTVFPGTTRNVLLPLLEEESGKVAGVDFGLVTNPEFLRESSAITDFYDPPFTIIGESEPRAGALGEAIYEGLTSKVYRISIEEAEVLKMVCNAFHALKVGFANEIGRLCDAVGLGGHRVMELLCADTKLNISPAYLKPGFAFGGSCLPKDLRSLTFNARRSGVELPILEAIIPSNRLQIEAARIKIHELGARSVAVLGLSFKPGTDDLRESPVITLIRDLWQDGVDVLVHDPDVWPDKMLGSNREYLERQLPQINRILRPLISDALAGSEVVIVTQKRPEFIRALRGVNGRPVLDLVRVADDMAGHGMSAYRGMSC